jgi:hypothetical protein
MGNYFSEMNCIKATVITETNNDSSVEEVKKDENIPEEVKEPNPICDIEDCCKNKESCDKKECPKKDCCNKKVEESISK